MIKENISLKSYNTFNIDVQTRFFAEFKSIDELISLSKTEVFKNNKKLIIGGGSNLLFTKKYSGLVIKPSNKDIIHKEENEDNIYIKVGAGVIWDDFVNYCVDNNFGGIENLSLIPGNIGASAVQNIGAYGLEAKDVITNVYAFNIDTSEQIIINNKNCKFNYRDSIFKNEYANKYIITNVEFRLSKTNHIYNLNYGAIKEHLGKLKINLRNIRNAIVDIRNSKLPDTNTIGNAGSFFKNPFVSKEKMLDLQKKHSSIVSYFVDENTYKLAAGWLIEDCGWKGKRFVDAGVYKDQALVLVNYGNSSGKDIIELAEKITRSVKEKFGIDLESEVKFI